VRTDAARGGFALAAGLLFGLGLALSGMVNPAKVLGFLDIFGDWDPTLAGVMATAVPVTAVGYRLAARRPNSLTGAPHPAQPAPRIDRNLVAGALLFGVGWGLVGFCPGPAIEALVLDGRVWIFVAAMAAGTLAQRWWSGRRRPAASPPDGVPGVIGET
jgi:uncharacterized membrane protein YedE/YeeE